MSNMSFTRKLRGRMRSNTCRIVLLTSLVWVIVDFILIAHYSDCIGKDGWNCKRSNEYTVEVSFVNKNYIRGIEILKKKNQITQH